MTVDADVVGQADQVDGVPLLTAATAPGPMRAGLAFRVGQADETLATHGITHLLEHLVLHRHGITDYHVNGLTGVTTTEFVVQGEADEIAAYFAGICSALGDLPLDRFEAEKRILGAEAATRATPPTVQLPLWRHGARGHGLVSYPELGLRRLVPDDVSAWATKWFTRQNAVLWVSGGTAPAGLRLDLPEGERMPMPPEPSALPVTPAYFVGSDRYIAAHLGVRRTVAALAYQVVLERMLLQRLRREAGLSYAVQTGYERRSSDHAWIYALADTVPDQHGEAILTFMQVVQALARGEVPDDHLAAAIKQLAASFDRPESVHAQLLVAVFDQFSGRAAADPEERKERIRKLGADEIAAVAAEAYKSALVMTAGATRLEWAGLEAAPSRSRFAVSGVGHRSRRDRGEKLIVADDGVSVSRSEGAVTVLFEDCAAMLKYPDGGRALIGTDAMTVMIEPATYGLRPEVIESIENRVPTAAHVTMEARRPDAIVGPPTLIARLRGYRAAMSRRWLGYRVAASARSVERSRRGRLRPRHRIAVLSVIALCVLICGSSGVNAFSVDLVGVILVWTAVGIVRLRRRRR